MKKSCVSPSLVHWERICYVIEECCVSVYSYEPLGKDLLVLKPLVKGRAVNRGRVKTQYERPCQLDKPKSGAQHKRCCDSA